MSALDLLEALEELEEASRHWAKKAKKLRGRLKRRSKLKGAAAIAGGAYVGSKVGKAGARYHYNQSKERHKRTR